MGKIGETGEMGEIGKVGEMGEIGEVGRSFDFAQDDRKAGKCRGEKFFTVTAFFPDFPCFPDFPLQLFNYS